MIDAFWQQLRPELPKLGTQAEPLFGATISLSKFIHVYVEDR